MIKKDKEFILLNEFGDGVKHFLNIILALYLNENDTIYLDEIDNGIHYSLFDKLWEIIFKITKEHNVQVFATTHSKECIESYYKISKKLKDEDVTYIKMTKQKNGIIKAVVRDYKLLENSLEQSHEVRG
jgi:AAA15 family ATPase/GTPase